MRIVNNIHPTQPERVFGVKIYPFLDEGATEIQLLRNGFIEVREDGIAQFNINLEKLSHEDMMKLSEAIQKAMYIQMDIKLAIASRQTAKMRDIFGRILDYAPGISYWK